MQPLTPNEIRRQYETRFEELLKAWKLNNTLKPSELKVACLNAIDEEHAYGITYDTIVRPLVLLYFGRAKRHVRSEAKKKQTDFDGLLGVSLTTNLRLMPLSTDSHE